MTTLYPMVLSTTEPNNNVGMIKVRKYDAGTQTFDVTITENGKLKDFTGLTPFFCVKNSPKTGLGISEQIVTDIVDAKNGRLKYTLTDYDVQHPQTNHAYFAFKKLKDDETFELQFTTKDFRYTTIASIFDSGIHDSNYIWTFEEMLRLFKEWGDGAKEDILQLISDFKLWISNNQADFDKWLQDNKDYWAEWVESCREILEDIDPGGKILTELIDARTDLDGNTYPKLVDRLNNQIGKLSDFRSWDLSLIEKLKNESYDRGINVRWFGAKGDGVTNDAPSIQAALDYIASELEKGSHRTLFIPSGTYRIVQPLAITSQRLFIFMQGTSTILQADGGLPSLFNLKVPRPKSSSLVIFGGMLTGADVLINSDNASVDLIVTNTWFGNCKYHFKGSFVTFNLTGCILELAKVASIESENADGFRKANIVGNNFFGNGGYHINLIGDAEKKRVRVVNINGNTFDQANMEDQTEKTKPFIRLANADVVSIKGNVFNGDTNEYSVPNGFISALNCMKVDLDNSYTKSKGNALQFTSCESVESRGIISDCENGLMLSDVKRITVANTIESLSGYGVRVDKSADLKIVSTISKVQKTGIDIYGCDFIKINADVTYCNLAEGTTDAGIALRYGAGKGTFDCIIINSIIHSNKKYNVRVETGCKRNIIQLNHFGYDNPDTTILDVGEGTIKKDNYYGK